MSQKVVAYFPEALSKTKIYIDNSKSWFRNGRSVKVTLSRQDI